MNKEAAAFLAKANSHLAEAEAVLSLDLFNAAGRASYLAAFHAAQALIVETTGRSVKTHNGVRTIFQSLTKNDPRLPPGLRSFLAKSYNLEAVADYETGPGNEITEARASEAIAQAKEFVAFFVRLLGG